MPTKTFPFSELLRESGSLVSDAECGNVLLQRRDGPDLVLKLAERETSEKENVASILYLLTGALASLTEKQTGDLLLQVFPWMDFLPESDRVEFAFELTSTLEGSDESDCFVLVGTLVRQWKNTADIWRDPELRRRLAGPETGSSKTPRR